MKVTEQVLNSDTEDAVLAFLSGQVTKIFDLVNQNLRRLDNGGYKVIFNGTIQRFENSDVKIEKTYVDRTDGNKTKTFDSSDMFSHTFTFQEAVEKMPGRCENSYSHMILVAGTTSTSGCWPSLAVRLQKVLAVLLRFSSFAFLMFFQCLFQHFQNF